MQLKPQQATLKPQQAAAAVWWRLLRPHTLTASFIPVFVGTAMALYDAQIKISLFLLMMLASLLIQSATNMINEYYDFVRGLDHEHTVGIGGTIVRDGVSPKTILRLAIIFYVISIAIGVYICMMSSWWVAFFGLLSILVSYFYSAGPLPISNTPFGELFSGLFMGPVIIMISYYIQTENLSLNSFLLSLSVGLLIGAINLANNIRDLDGDKEHGRKTLAILLGRGRAVVLLANIFVVSFITIVVLVILGQLTPWALIVMISIPKAIQAIRQFRGKSIAIEMVSAMKSTAQLNTLFGFLLSFGLVIAYIVHL